MRIAMRVRGRWLKALLLAGVGLLVLLPEWKQPR